ncbi:MAG TPA: JAB domain-containing protein [Burkholderiaceae bacterium]
MSRRTVTQTPVYPREVVKGALLKGSSAVLRVRNHPSGSTDPCLGR